MSVLEGLWRPVFCAFFMRVMFVVMRNFLLQLNVCGCFSCFDVFGFSDDGVDKLVR